MKKAIPVYCTALFLTGCFAQFPSLNADDSGPDTDTDSDIDTDTDSDTDA
ncbi:MAG: hypothetical protein JRF63_07565, partial [Deltaproteobacteria bacterium]|nr:hypothetical protein [Deltaproteobacteria bacterium]